jgi:hypothetical protein
MPIHFLEPMGGTAIVVSECLRSASRAARRILVSALSAAIVACSPKYRARLKPRAANDLLEAA